MGKSRDTDIDGNSAFDDTHWSQIGRAQTSDTSSQQEAIDALLKRYWKPVYCYLRRKGHRNEAAKDLTQGFFHEVVLGRELIQQANRARGRFRTFLLTSLDRYATSVHRAQTAQKRSPKSGLVRLDGIDSAGLSEPASDATPVQAFNHAWALALLDQALGEVEHQCRQADQAVHWELFRARVVAPILDNATPPSLAELCAEHGVAAQAQVSNMIVTVKRQFRAALRRLARQFAGSEAEVDEEIRDLMDVLSARGASGRP